MNETHSFRMPFFCLQEESDAPLLMYGIKAALV